MHIRRPNQKAKQSKNIIKNYETHTKNKIYIYTYIYVYEYIYNTHGGYRCESGVGIRVRFPSAAATAPRTRSWACPLIGSDGGFNVFFMFFYLFLNTHMTHTPHKPLGNHQHTPLSATWKPSTHT